MQETNTLLFETECFGAIINHVKVFPTYITYHQKCWGDISVPLHMVASVEAKVYEHGFVSLRTTSRRRIICTVYPPHRADALCAAIRAVQLSPTTTAALNVP